MNKFELQELSVKRYLPIAEEVSLHLFRKGNNSETSTQIDRAYLCMCAQIHAMGSKNISITEEAYTALSRERRRGESFTEAILRLTRRSGRLADCFGTWKMSEEEKKTLFEKELPAGWAKSKERLKAIKSEMP